MIKLELVAVLSLAVLPQLENSVNDTSNVTVGEYCPPGLQPVVHNNSSTLKCACADGLNGYCTMQL